MWLQFLQICCPVGVLRVTITFTFCDESKFHSNRQKCIPSSIRLKYFSMRRISLVTEIAPFYSDVVKLFISLSDFLSLYLPPNSAIHFAHSLVTHDSQFSRFTMVTRGLMILCWGVCWGGGVGGSAAAFYVTKTTDSSFRRL